MGEVRVPTQKVKLALQSWNLDFRLECKQQQIPQDVTSGRLLEPDRYRAKIVLSLGWKQLKESWEDNLPKGGLSSLNCFWRNGHTG